MDDDFDALIAAAQAGAEWAWGRLVRGVAPQLLGYLRFQGAREPEDLLGEVLLQLARNIGRFVGGEQAFRSRTFTVAHHRIIDERRRLRRHPVDAVGTLDEGSVVSGDTTSAAVLERLEIEAIKAKLAEIAPAQRDVLLLRIVAGLTVQEIAAATGRSPGAVKALQRRGLAALERSLSQGGIPQ
jgi:RNA polymerase sigma-70 factor (ECF subfamily)